MHKQQMKLCIGSAIVILTCLTDLHCEESLIVCMVAQGTQGAIAGKVWSIQHILHKCSARRSFPLHQSAALAGSRVSSVLGRVS